MSRIFAIPDIHGMKNLLDALLLKLETEEKLNLTQDKLIFLGDYVDRGPDSRGVIATIKALVEKHPDNVIALAGNHEWMFIDGLIHKNTDQEYLWLINGGEATKASYFGYDDMEDHVKWLATLPLSHEEPGFFFSHAPAPREHKRLVYLQGQPFTKQELTWSYGRDEKGIAREFENGVVGVCGHIHALNSQKWKPRLYDHYILADAGAGCHKLAALVAIEVKSRKIIYAWPEKDMTEYSAK